MSKAQVSMETFLIVGVVVLIFISLLVVTNYLKKDIREDEDMIKQRRDCLLLTNTINSIDANSNNAFINININNKALVRGPNQMIYFDDYLCRFNPKNITNGTYNIFNISKGCVKVQYQDGIMVVNNDCVETEPPGCSGTVSFRTNAEDGDYIPSTVWMAVDADKDGTLDPFMRRLTTDPYSAFFCDSISTYCDSEFQSFCILTLTPEGYKVVNQFVSPNYIPYICFDVSPPETKYRLYFDSSSNPGIEIDSNCIDQYAENNQETLE